MITIPAPGEVSVYLARSEVVVQPEKSLTDAELQRAAKFRTSELASDWRAAHALLRRVCGACLNMSPQDIEFTTGPNGKPAVVGLEVNLSHATGLAAVAVAHCPVGVDVESVRSDIEHDRLAQRFFSTSEREQLQTVPDDERRLAFFNCWTRKEAVVKASGRGIAVGLSDFDVDVTGPAALLDVRTPDLNGPWVLEALDVGAGYVGCVAVRTTTASVNTTWLGELKP